MVSYENTLNHTELNLALVFILKGPNTDPIFLNSLTITPDPFKLPGTVSITANVDFKTNITGPLAMQLKIYKIIGPLKLEIPCVDNVGSCNYADVCTLLPLPTDCPSMFKEQGIPCSCNLKQISKLNPSL